MRRFFSERLVSEIIKPNFEQEKRIMRTLSLSLVGLAVAILATGALWGEEQPRWPSYVEWDGSLTVPTSSGVFNLMSVTASDVPWNGSGSVSIPFTLNQRATVWLAVYEKGSNETGARGPFGAWVRLEPQDLFIAVTPGQAFEAGSNTITWNGLDWDGKSPGSGNYEFDLIAINNLDMVSIAGPTMRDPGNPFGETVIDTRYDPPEVWSQEHDAENLDAGQRAGDVIRYNLGTDFLANATAWERWQYNSEVFTHEGAYTWSGLRPDDLDREIFWTNQAAGDGGGIYKMKIDRTNKTWVRVPEFGESGFAAIIEPRQAAIEPWEDIIYAANWNRVDNPVPSLQSWDKQSGEMVREIDLTDFFISVRDDGSVRATGPGKIGANEHGVWLDSWSNAPFLFLKHDGTVMWANGNGDVIGDVVDNPTAAATGMTATLGEDFHIAPSGSGHVVFFSETANTRGSIFNALGRDGSGLFDVFFSQNAGPFRPDRYTHVLSIVDEGGNWDGLYHGSPMSLLTQDYEFAENERSGPGMLLFIPYDMASGRLGAGVTAVEETGSTSRPSSYSLGAAYPNPFNPETTIEFAVPAGAEEWVKLEVYNTAGQPVTTLVDESLSAGAYKTRWDARDQHGEPVSSGVYFYRMQAGDFVATHSMTLLK